MVLFLILIWLDSMNRENKEEIDDKKIFWKIMKLGNNKI